MTKLLITGSAGQVGQELKEILKGHSDFESIFYKREDLDISNEMEVKKSIHALKPDFIINTAAYTAVDKAETEQDLAFKVNQMGPKWLAKYGKEHKAWLIHISSDYVYHHNPGRALKEEDSKNPQSVYATSKWKGDQEVINSGIDYSILRTSWVYSSFGNNFVKTMRRLGKERDALTIVSDQFGTPTYARDIAMAIQTMITQINQNPQNEEFKDVFNFSNLGITNWSSFAKKIFEMENIDCSVTTLSTASYGAPAPRPLWSVLDKTKFQRVWKANLRPWEDSLGDCLSILKK